MSPLKISLVVAALSALATAGGLHRHHQGRIREARHLRAQNDRMRLEATRRAASAVASAPQRAVLSEIPVPAASPAAPHAAGGADYYRNEGNATPRAALQTFAWACDRGDLETVQRLVHIEEAARPKVDAFVAALPENVRRQWKSVDETVAALLTQSVMARPFPRADVLETATPEELGPGRVRLRMPDVPRDGTEYQQTADGWKYVLTEKMVDDYLRRHRPGPK